MPVNYADQQEVSRFRKTLIDSGYDQSEVDKHIAKKMSEYQAASAVASGYIGLTDIPQESRVSAANILRSSNVGLPQKPEDLSGEEKKQTFNAASGLRAIQTVRSELSSGGRGKLFASTLPGSPGARVYKTASKEIADVLTRLRTGAQINDFELDFYTGQLPSPLDSQETIDYKLKMFEDLFSSFAPNANTTQAAQPTNTFQDRLPELPPPLDVSGQSARDGSMVRDSESGKLVIYGSANDDPLFKVDTSTGGRVDNALISFLADSGFLPIAGSIIGGIAGGIPGGAAGAAGGKALQQSMRELRNPDESNLSQHAKIVLVEGLTDALISGLTLGAFKVGEAGIGLVLKKAEHLAAQEGAESLAAKLAKKGLGITKSQGAKYAKATHGLDFGEQMIKTGNIPASAEEAVAIGESGIKEAKNKITAALSGKSVKVGDLVKILEESKTPYIRGGQTVSGTTFEGGIPILAAPVTKPTVVLPAAERGVREIDDYIKFIRTFGADDDLIPATEVNKIKSGLQESFGKGLDVSGASKQTVTGASTKVKKLLEKIDPSIVGTNREVIFYHLMNEAGLKEMNNVQVKNLASLTDVVLGTSSLPALAVKKIVQSLAGDPLQQARLLSALANSSKGVGGKQALRKVLDVALGMKMPISISPVLRKAAFYGSTGAATDAMVGGESSPPVQPSLDAFSTEGAPLYK